MVFDPSVYEPVPITHESNSHYSDLDSDIDYDSDYDSDYDALFDFQIRHDIQLAGMMDEDVFVNRMTLIDELDIILSRRNCGVQILLPPIRG